MPDPVTSTRPLSRTISGVSPRVRCILAAGLVFAAIGHITEPQQLIAQSNASTSSAYHAQFTEQLASHLADSHAILAICPRVQSGSTDIVLWLRDVKNPGMVDPDEIAVLAHAPFLRALMWYSFDPVHNCDMRAVPVEQIVLSARQFADAWKSSLHVRPQFIRTGVSDMAAHISRSSSTMHAGIRIDLIWAGETSDGVVSTSSSASLEQMREGARHWSGE